MYWKIYIITMALFLAACGSSEEQTAETSQQEEEHDHGNAVLLNQEQVDLLGLKIAPMGQRDLQHMVKANGQLEVPPQNEASVTAMIGANVFDIQVIEGDMVKEGQTIAYLSHPNLISIQSEYQVLTAELEYLTKEFNREQKLSEKGYTSGKSFEKKTAEYKAKMGKQKGIEAQLELLHINPKQVAEGKIYKKIPITTPIAGSVKLVQVKTGQYVNAEQELFALVNNEHVHADLMVYEKDVTRIAEGQKVRFKVGAMPNREYTATIYAIGKSFESDPKAVHVHADIENIDGSLLPGMYVNGQIVTDSVKTLALPDEAIVKDEGTFYIFKAAQHDGEWEFTTVPVFIGTQNNGWSEVVLKSDVETHQHDHDHGHSHGHDVEQYAWNNAYVLLSEMKKGEGGHSHHH